MSRRTEWGACDAVILGTGLISCAGRGPTRVLQAMHSHLNLFGCPGGPRESRRLPWPVAEVQPADALWPATDQWWLNNQKFANISARWAVAAAIDAIAMAQPPG